MIDIVARHIVPAAMAVLPPEMNTRPAHAEILTIGLQESRFLYRRQMNYGPARSFWQFEIAGVRGVMRHEKSAGPLKAALRQLRYEHLIGQTSNLHHAIEHNDVLGCVFARLLLWTVPGRLPGPGEPRDGWEQYLEGWRPGKPHRETWDAFYKEAWERVTLLSLEDNPK